MCSIVFTYVFKNYIWLHDIVIFHVIGHCFSNQDGNTKVNLDILSLSAKEDFNATSIQQAVEQAINLAKQNGKLGDYDISPDPDSIIFETPFIGRCPL